MNEKVYGDIIHGNPPGIFDDEEHVVWVERRDDEVAIVESLSEKLDLASLVAACQDANNEHGEEVVITCNDQSQTVNPADGLDPRHATLNAVGALLSPGFQIRFATDTSGSDTPGIVVERVSDWQLLYDRHGPKINEHFCPIREVSDVMTTPGDRIDEACREYANRFG